MAHCIHGTPWDGISPFFCNQCGKIGTGPSSPVMASPILGVFDSESLQNALSLLDAATKRAAEQEALAAARLQEVQQLQDEVVGLQVALGDALDREERYKALSAEDVRRADETYRKMNSPPGEKLREALERFRRAFRSRV